MEKKLLRKRIIAILIVILVVLNISMLTMQIVNAEEEATVDADPILEGILEKYINYNLTDTDKGTLVQYHLRTGIHYKEKSEVFPIKENETTIHMGQIDGKYPYDVKVIMNGTNATNGNMDKDSYTNSEYHADTGVLTIKMHNQDENDNILSDNIPSPDSRDDYVLICYYDTYTNTPVEREVSLNLSSKITVFSDDNQEIHAEGEIKNTVTENMGDLTSVKHETEDIYNGYIKSNIINATEYNTQYTETANINVSKKEVHQKMQIKEENTFVRINDEDSINDLGNQHQLVYKSTKLEKQNIVELLGEEGSVELLDENGNIVATIDKNTQFAEDGTITIDYENEVETLYIRTSYIVNEGTLHIENTKEIKNTMRDIENVKIKTITNIIGINEEVVTQTEENTEEKQIVQKESYRKIDEHFVEIKDAQNHVNMTVNSTEWTNKQQNDITFDISLYSDSIRNNLFKDTTLKIQLPSQVEKVILGNYSMVYGNGLTLQEPYLETDENGNISIIANLLGAQTQYDQSNLGLMTDVHISATIILKKDVENITDKVTLGYTNHYTLDGSILEGNIEIPLNIQSYMEEQNPLEEIIQDVNLSEQNTTQDISNRLKMEVTPVKGDVTLNNGDIVYEGEYIKYNIKMTNISDTAIENVKVVGNIPDGLVYGELKADYEQYNGDYYYRFDSAIKEKTIDIGTIEAGKTYETFYEVQVQDLANGENQKEVVSAIKAYVGETEATNDEIIHIIQPSEVKIFLDAKLDNGYNRWNYGVQLTGNTGEEVTVQIKLPEEFKIKWFACNDVLMEIPNEMVTVSEDNVVTAKLTIGEAPTYLFEGHLEDDTIDKNTNEGMKTIIASATASVNGKVYTANENRIEYAYRNATIVMTSPTEGQELHYGEEIEYDIAITNVGGVNSTLPNDKAIAVRLTDFLPEDIQPVSVIYETWEQKTNTEDNESGTTAISNDELVKQEFTLDISNISEDEDGNKLPNVDIICHIPYKETVHIKIITTAGYVAEDTKIENNATITATETIVDDEEEVEKIFLNKTSNTIAHTILSGIDIDPDDPEEPTDPEDPDHPEDPNYPSEDNYTISGIAWVDSNEDGARQSTENVLGNIRVILVNMQKANTIDAETITGENGRYQFTNLDAGNYMVLFIYDNANYTVTAYKKNGVPENSNSDVSEQEITLLGERVTVAATDILPLQNHISNIDMGLVENKVFDLSLHKSISGVTVETNKKTSTYGYDNAELAKIDIRAKEIEGAKVTVEYKITVTNEGELEATVEKVVDYLPEGFRLDAVSGQSWRNQGDNTVINESIQNQKLLAGESITLTLTATKTMTADTTGIFINKAEIGEASNSKQIADNDSTPGNGIETEDDFSKAEIIISIGTGIGVYISIGLVVAVLLAIAVCIGVKKGKIHIHQFSKIFKLSMFVIVFVTMICMQGSKTIAAPIKGNYVSSTTEFTFIGGAHGTRFRGGPFGWGECMNKGTPNQDMYPPYYKTYDLKREKGTVKKETITSTGSIKLSKGASNVTMRKLDNNYYILGPFIINCNNSNGYSFQVRDRNNAVVNGVSTCNSNGNNITVKGNATFYLKIPASACEKGISVVKATNTAKVTQTKKQTVQVNAEYAPNVLKNKQWVSTSGNVNKDVTTTTNVSASVEWTNFNGALEIIKKDADDANVNLSGVQIRVQNQAVGYDKTFTTDASGKIHIDNLQLGTYTITEVSNNHYGYSKIEKGQVTIYSGKIAGFTLKNEKQTGNLKIYKKDTDNDTIVLPGVSFKLKNSEGEYIIGVDTNGNPISQATGSVHLSNLQIATDIDQATEFITDSKGCIQIYNLLIDTYTVSEISIGDNFGYELDDNFISWESGGAVGSGNIATVTITRQTSINTGNNSSGGDNVSNVLTIKNKKKYIKISGFAWEDRADGKNSTKDYTWHDGTEDKKLANVIVRLKDANGQIMDETITDENGEYVFGNYDEDTDAIKLQIDDLVKAYIEFEYNGMSYQSIKVNPEFIRYTEIDANGNTISKYGNNKNTATDEALREEFHNNYATIHKGKTSTTNGNDKYHIQYQYDAENHESHVIYGDHVKYGYEGQRYPISGTYDQYTLQAMTEQSSTKALCTNLTPEQIRQEAVVEIGGLNLGVEERQMPDLFVIEDMEKVEMSLQDPENKDYYYTHTYQYAQRFEDPENYAGGKQINASVKFANKYLENSYSRDVYSSDLIYNQQTGKEGALQIYVTYRIKIINESSSLYTNLKTLANYYDERYENIVVKDEEGNRIAFSENGYDNPNGLKRVDIQTNYFIPSGKSRELTITYQLNNNAINSILNEQLTLESITEVTSYSSYSDEVGTIPYAGIDVDSAPDTVEPIKTAENTINITDTIEDDTDKAPSFILNVKEGRIIQGTVWEDSAIQELLDKTGYDKERKGDGIYDVSNENVVQGVQVELMTVEEDGTYQVADIYQMNGVPWEPDKVMPAHTNTNEKGEYSFVGVIPDKYAIRYTYKDESMIVTPSGETLGKVDVDNYKATIYRGGNPPDEGNHYWYREETGKDAVRLSDAKDTFGIMQDDSIVDIVKERIEQDKDIYYQTIAENSKLKAISADTAEFEVKLDYDIHSDNFSVYADRENGNGLKFTFDNMDFGIIERPKQSLEIQKEVANIQIILANGNELLNGDPRNQNLSGVRVLDDDVYIEIDNEIIQGSTLRITYEISVDNRNCEIDYNNEDYYVYGTVPTGNADWKIATIIDMYDYLPEDLVLQSTEGDNWQRIDIQEQKDNVKGIILEDEIYDEVKGRQNVIHLANPIFENMAPGSEAIDTSMVVSKVLSTSTDDLAYENDIEVVKLKGRTTYDSIPGNYNPTTNESYDPKTDTYTGDELDDDTVDLIITPPTGESRAYWIYGIIGISILIVIGVGIVMIKRKVL